MPLYEYECQHCHRRVEKIQKFSDAPLTTCPHCGGTLERTLTAPAIQFKGSGWYKDLYSSARPATSNSGDGAPSSSGDSSGDAGKKGSDTGSTGNAAPASSSPAPAAPAPAASAGGSDK